MIGILIVLAAAWVFCGFVNAGFYYAYMQREYPEGAEANRMDDTSAAWGSVLFGTAALIATILTGFYKHGWLLPGRKP